MLIKFCYYHNGIQIVVNEDLTFNPILRIMEFKVLFIVSFFGGGGGRVLVDCGETGAEQNLSKEAHLLPESKILMVLLV